MMKLKNQAEINQVRNQMQTAQKDKCALCKGSFTDAKLVKKKLVRKLIPTLDHDHSTGIIRGVLCNNCNSGEGKINNLVKRCSRDLTDEEWLDNLVAYRKFHNIPRTAYIHPTFKTADEKDY